MTELKPCPFCGGKARTFEFSWHASQFGGHMFEKSYWQVICESCKAAIGDFDSKTEAIESWNTRATDAENAELLEKVKRQASELDAMRRALERKNSELRPWTDQAERFARENAKLRECLQDIANTINSGFGIDYGWMLSHIRALGIEVE